MEHVRAVTNVATGRRDVLRAEVLRWRKRLRFGSLLGLHSLARGTPRSYLRLPSAAQCEVWLICWPPGSRAPLHDHGGARGIASVLCGELQEVIYQRGDGPSWVERTWGPDALITLSSEACHEVFNPHDETAYSLHVYEPRLLSMTYYARTPAGGVEVLRSEGADRW
jgi:hypothetical protein